MKTSRLIDSPEEKGELNQTLSKARFGQFKGSVEVFQAMLLPP